jgi:hypothetical protein
MYDPTSLFPEGYHPVDVSKSPDRSSQAKHLSRMDHPCTYYFIDFGLAERYIPSEGEPAVPIVKGADRTAPEHQSQILEHEMQEGNTNQFIRVNPFFTDVYYLGNMIRTDFLEVCCRL